jgi:deazaflavin-dependent oxidoreductase (nitroreductase family)
MLLLSTQGRRSGLVRTMPLAYLPDPEDDESYVVVGSNGGAERPPAWWLNLQARDEATVQVGRESFLVRAERAPEDRRSALWQMLRRRIPPYRVYERIEREIPIVLLHRLPPATSTASPAPRESLAGGPGRGEGRLARAREWPELGTDGFENPSSRTESGPHPVSQGSRSSEETFRDVSHGG